SSTAATAASSKGIVSLNYAEVLLLTSLLVVFVLDINNNSFSVPQGGSVITTLCDALDFNLIFRTRSSPTGSPISSYHVNSNELSQRQCFYIFLSCFGIKFTISSLLDFCFFGIVKIPKLKDLAIFLVAFCLVQLSYRDIVFRKLTQNPLYGLTHSFGVGILKSRKVESAVLNALKHGLNPIGSVSYLLLSMELTGTA